MSDVPKLPPETFDTYSELLVRLFELLGEHVRLGVRIGVPSVDCDPPGVLACTGILGPLVAPDGENAAEAIAVIESLDAILERETTLSLSVGPSTILTLHPQHFGGGFWSAECRHLSFVMGHLSLWIVVIEDSDEG